MADGERTADATVFIGGWVAASALALAAAASAIVTSQGFHAAPVTTPASDPTPPAVAAHLIGTRDVERAIGEPAVPLIAAPPQQRLFQSSRPSVADWRDEQYDGAWGGLWTNRGADIAIEITIYDYTDPYWQEGDDIGCTAATELDLELEGWTGYAGIGIDGVGPDASCFDLRRGDQRVFGHTAFNDGRSRTEQVGAISGLVTRQAAALPDPVLDGSGPTTVAVPRGRAHVLRGWMLALIGLGLLVTVPVNVMDTGWLRRLAAVMGRRRHVQNRDPGRRDLTGASRLLRWRLRALGLAHFAVLVSALRLTEVIRMGGLQTGVLLVATHAGLLLARRDIVRRWVATHTIRLFVGTNAVIIALGTIFSLGLMVVSALMWQVGQAFSLFTPGGTPDWQMERISVATQIAAFLVLAAAALTPLTLARKLVMTRLRKRGVTDDRVPVLLLRSFTDDRLTIRSRRHDRAGLLDQLALGSRDRFEEVLASTMAKFGPVVAVGTPGEQLAPALGAVRREFSDEDWQQAVHSLAEEAPFIVLVVGRSEGTVWEMRRIVDAGLTHKTILVIPPVGRSEERRRLALVAEVFGVPWTLLDTSDRAHSVLAITMPLGSRPLAYVSSVPDDLAYDLAMAEAVRSVEAGDLVDVMSMSSASVSSPGPSAPAAEVIPAGKYRRPAWWARPSTTQTILLVNVVVLPSVLYVFLGTTNADATHLPLPDGAAVPSILVPGGSPKAMYALWGDELARVDFTEEPATLSSVATLPNAPSEAVQVDDAIIWIDRAGGMMGRTTVTGRTMWTRSVPQGARGLSASADVVAVALPETAEVALVSASDGDARRVSVGGTPWGTAVSGGVVAVSDPDRSALTTVRIDSATVGDSIPLDSPASSVWTFGEQWVVAVERSRVVQVIDADGARATILREAPYGAVDVHGSALAIQGVDRSSVFTPGGMMRYLTEVGVRDLTVLSDGSLVVMTDDAVTRRPPSTAEGPLFGRF